jgi:hypothetical protein
MRIGFLGDIVSRSGRSAVLKAAPLLKRNLGLDLLAANGENASGGVGLAPDSAEVLLAGGIDFLTSGNHIWKHREIAAYLDKSDRLLRPANFPDPAPGRGVGVFRTSSGISVAFLNLQGRTFMEPIDCPFAAADQALAALPEDVKVILVDFHAEATSEKTAMGFYLDGRVSAVLGTHTHAPTADATVLPNGTAYLSDLGMCGPWPSCLGMDPGPILGRFRTGRPSRFKVSKAAAVVQGAVLDIDEKNGKCRAIRLLTREDGEAAKV